MTRVARVSIILIRSVRMVCSQEPNSNSDRHHKVANKKSTCTITRARDASGCHGNMCALLSRVDHSPFGFLPSLFIRQSPTQTLTTIFGLTRVPQGLRVRESWWSPYRPNVVRVCRHLFIRSSGHRQAPPPPDVRPPWSENQRGNSGLTHIIS